jgi:hypothetical protein
LPEETECPRCPKPGFVRLENVIKGYQARRVFYCGACGHEWSVSDDGSVQSNRTSDRPDRSRSQG